MIGSLILFRVFIKKVFIYSFNIKLSRKLMVSIVERNSLTRFRTAIPVY